VLYITVTAHFAYGTLRLLDSLPTVWSFRLLDTSPTGHFAYETFRLLDSSLIGQFAYCLDSSLTDITHLILFYSGSLVGKMKSNLRDSSMSLHTSKQWQKMYLFVAWTFGALAPVFRDWRRCVRLRHLGLVDMYGSNMQDLQPKLVSLVWEWVASGHLAPNSHLSNEWLKSCYDDGHDDGTINNVSDIVIIFIIVIIASSLSLWLASLLYNFIVE